MKLYEYEQEHLDRLRPLLPECTVLLKKNGDFPLDKPGKIALYGNGVRRTVKGGTGSGEVNSRFFETVEDGLKNAGFEITSTEWLDAYDKIYAENQKGFFKKIRERALENHTHPMIEGMGAIVPEPEYNLPLTAEGDTAVYVLARISGEGTDRTAEEGDILLTKSEKRTIFELNRKYKKFLLVLNTGGVMDISSVAEVKNILLLSQLGVQTGSALADILLGKAYPSGKLTATWAKWEDYPDFASFGEWDDTRYKEGIYVGYRYFDTVEKEVLFPFGYGLSYTEFKTSFQSLALDKMTVQIEAETQNIGNFAGKEVVQLYVSSPEMTLDQPYQSLAAWTKTEELLPTEKENVQLSFHLTDLASYDENREIWILEQGTYILRLGVNSRDTEICGSISVAETLIVRKVKKCFGKADFKDWKPVKKRQTEPEMEMQTLKVDSSEWETEIVSYKRENDISPEISALSDEKLIRLHVGAFAQGEGMASIIGNASVSVAGAAGETARVGAIPAIIMADGPAGLRLNRQYFQDETGVHGLGGSMPETMKMLLTDEEAAYMESMQPKPKDNSEIFEQYATAIPIETAIAQSWNPSLAEVCGDIVGSEMERFGVHLWLAPALNIQRSIRCGRNYEYFSEDPLVSGVFAAAITKGVQSHPGCGVTIKHFAANNQETNRYFNNSIVSERALREIYLKGFEQCIRIAKPKALMTSYNLLNGIHTSERRDLLEDVLRCEFGFDGIVMTDWVISSAVLNTGAKYSEPEAYKVALAGNDLFMPGSQKEIENLRHALRDGRISRERLLENAERIYEMAKELNQAHR